jgi:hypothetical protein
MILKKLLCILGLGILAPEVMYAVPKPAVPVCVPTALDCAAQTVVGMVQAASCDKHEQTNPKGLSATTGTGIEQPCKAVVSPQPAPK